MTLGVAIHFPRLIATSRYDEFLVIRSFKISISIEKLKIPDVPIQKKKKSRC